MAAQPTLIHSVVRALNLLDAVGAANNPVPAKRLANEVGLPLSTTYHLLRTLVHQGYLLRTTEGYVLGDRVDGLGSSAQPRRVRRVLQQLHDDTGAAVYFSVQEDGEIRLAEIVDSPAAPRTDLWVGIHEAAHATALGKAVVGAMDTDAQREYFRSHPLVGLTPHTITNVQVLQRQFVGATDLKVDREEYALGTFCIAVAVPKLPMSVAVSMPAHREAVALAHAPAVRRAASLIALAHG